MSVLIDWENIPWNEPEGRAQPGYRDKTWARDGQRVRLAEYTEGFVKDNWCTEGHLIHVLEGESSMRLKNGTVIRLRPGDTGVLLAGEGDAHRMEMAAGERILFLAFEQP